MPTACFTGHRRINGAYYNYQTPTLDWLHLRDRMLEVVLAFATTSMEVNEFISGMAIGVDQLAAECVLLTRTHEGLDLALTAAIPFPSQPSNWPINTQERYYWLLGQAQAQIISPDPYTPAKMHVRDRWMVDNSNYVIAIWDGRKQGGTYATLTYAVQTGKPIFWINPLLDPIEGAWFDNVNLI